VLDKSAPHYEEDTDRRLNNFISIIEPTLVISLSFVVGLILLSVILPLMGIMSGLG
jgi:type IV pilus assembly protein PilC